MMMTDADFLPQCQLKRSEPLTVEFAFWTGSFLNLLKAPKREKL